MPSRSPDHSFVAARPLAFPRILSCPRTREAEWLSIGATILGSRCRENADYSPSTKAVWLPAARERNRDTVRYRLLANPLAPIARRAISIANPDRARVTTGARIPHKEPQHLIGRRPSSHYLSERPGRRRGDAVQPGTPGPARPSPGKSASCLGLPADGPDSLLASLLASLLD